MDGSYQQVIKKQKFPFHNVKVFIASIRRKHDKMEDPQDQRDREEADARPSLSERLEARELLFR